MPGMRLYPIHEWDSPIPGKSILWIFFLQTDSPSGAFTKTFKAKKVGMG